MGFQWSEADCTVGAGFLRIARGQIDKAIAVADDTSQTTERRVHEARRRCKKLRALFRLGRPDFSEYDEENNFVRNAARGLSGARDTRVLQRTLEDLMQWAGQPLAAGEHPTDPVLETETRTLADFAGKMRELLDRTGSWSLDRLDDDTLVTGLEQTYDKARRLGRAAERKPTDEALHEWRKFAKYHWNQLGLLESCAPDILPGQQKAAGDLADHLGSHHDLSLLCMKLETDPAALGRAFDVATALDAASRRRDELEQQIAALRQQIFAERPRALKARFAAYLDGWQDRQAA